MILHGVPAAGFALFLPYSAYIIIGNLRMRKLLYRHLKNQGIAKSDVRSVIVMHSFFNLLLHRPEWEIEVMFKDEPDAVYFYKYRRDQKTIVIQSANHIRDAAGREDDFKHFV